MHEYVQNQASRMFDVDRPRCDLLIVMGTELAVEPISLIPSKMPEHVPIVLINRNMVKIPQTERPWSVCLLGNCGELLYSISSLSCHINLTHVCAQR